MKSENETILLRDKEIEPTDEVLENSLGKELFTIYQKLIQIFTDEFSLELQWRFYKDGKSWLCKVVYKKKTILWLSVWQNYIKTGFYFTEKTRNGVLELGIDKKIKETFSVAKPVGKLMPLIIDIDQQKQIEDLKKLIKYKKEVK
ncbi:MAG: DUF3788 family protein [Bacteroidales bacterium]|jgi:hypothetical protein|nr:DUF3788 family protein [Bacteroidales bacterium]